MLSFLRFRRGKRDQKRRRSTTSWSPALESLEELILLSPTPGWMTSATSSINVAPAPVTATQLVVTTPAPTSVTANAPFGLTVTAENGSGKIATTYNGRVTLGLSGGTTDAKLGSTLTVTAVNGVAAFTGLTINTAGTGYTLTASSGTLTSAKSSINVPVIAGAHTITFQGLDSAGGDNTAFLDQVAVAPSIGDPGFEQPAVGTGALSTTPPAHRGSSPAARASPATTAASPRAIPPHPRGSRSPSSREPARSPSRSPAGQPGPTCSPSTPPSAATSECRSKTVRC